MLQRQPGSPTHTVGLQPALHPDVAAFGLPDLGELQDAAAARTLKQVVPEGSFDPLAPFEILEGLGQGFQVEEGDWRRSASRAVWTSGTRLRLTLRA